MKIQFMSLASGSSGNCYYLGNEKYGILIDAGIGVRSIKRTLKSINRPIETIRAIFVTHDHADHIKALANLGEKCHIPVYTTKRVHEGINRNYCMREKLCDSVRYLEKEQTMQLEAFTITNFEVPHDGSDNVGYRIVIDGKTFCFATDIGHITTTAANYLSQANYLILEANYDEEMLRMGFYPTYLKERVAGPTGHLSNKESAAFIANHFTPALKYVWLCHLSKDNNHPELVMKTMEYTLREKGITMGIDLHVIPLKRTAPSVIYTFE